MYAKDLFNYEVFVEYTLHSLARARELFSIYNRRKPTHLSVNISNVDGWPKIEIDFDKEFDHTMTNWLSDEIEVRHIFFGFTHHVESFINNLYNDFEAKWIEEA
jgi:hypothetical protein